MPPGIAFRPRTGAEKTGSTGGYHGPSYADFLPFDLDGDDLDRVLEDVRSFLKELEFCYEVDGLRGAAISRARKLSYLPFGRAVQREEP